MLVNVEPREVEGSNYRHPWLKLSVEDPHGLHLKPLMIVPLKEDLSGPIPDLASGRYFVELINCPPSQHEVLQEIWPLDVHASEGPITLGLSMNGYRKWRPGVATGTIMLPAELTAVTQGDLNSARIYAIPHGLTGDSSSLSLERMSASAFRFSASKRPGRYRITMPFAGIEREIEIVQDQILDLGNTTVGFATFVVDATDGLTNAPLKPSRVVLDCSDKWRYAFNAETSTGAAPSGNVSGTVYVDGYRPLSFQRTLAAGPQVLSLALSKSWGEIINLGDSSPSLTPYQLGSMTLFDEAGKEMSHAIEIKAMLPGGKLVKLSIDPGQEPGHAGSLELRARYLLVEPSALLPEGMLWDLKQDPTTGELEVW